MSGKFNRLINSNSKTISVENTICAACIGTHTGRVEQTIAGNTISKEIREISIPKAYSQSSGVELA